MSRIPKERQPYDHVRLWGIRYNGNLDKMHVLVVQDYLDDCYSKRETLLPTSKFSSIPAGWESEEEARLYLNTYFKHEHIHPDDLITALSWDRMMIHDHQQSS